MAENIKRTQNILEIKTIKSLFKQIEYPNWAVSGEKDFNGTNYSVGTSYLTKPFVMVEETHSHDFDQILFFVNADLRKPKDFDAEVEMTLEEEGKLEKHLINYAACVYIPAGTLHCPLYIKKVNKPITFVDVTLSPRHSIRPLPKTSEKGK
jgi:hypothetical protein